jgi:hypothetical protein
MMEALLEKEESGNRGLEIAYQAVAPTTMVLGGFRNLSQIMPHRVAATRSTPTDTDAPRCRAHKRDLLVWFVSFGDGQSWASGVARQLRPPGTPTWA